MIKKYLIVILALVSFANAQTKNDYASKVADIAFTAGNNENSIATAYTYNWHLGKTKRWELGTGIRATSYFGLKRNYITAPARLARSTTIPFAIVFANQEVKNFDTLTVQRPFTIATNLTFNAGYHFNKNWFGGVNIDVIGYTFGRTTSALLMSNETTTIEQAAKPSNFNLLLTGDNDLGSLNSEFFVRYNFLKHWGLRGVYQFLFSEYKTTTPGIYQIAPDGTQVTRFRNKVNAFGVSLSYLW